MARVEPSSDWTDRERLETIGRIATEANRAMAASFINTKSIFDTMERIAFLASMPTSFLEVNRDHLLNGQFPMKEQL